VDIALLHMKFKKALFNISWQIHDSLNHSKPTKNEEDTGFVWK